MKNTIIRFFTLLFVFLNSCSGSGLTDYSVRVMVKDDEHVPVQGAQVTIANIAYGNQKQAIIFKGKTDGDGVVSLDTKGHYFLRLWVVKNEYFPSEIKRYPIKYEKKGHGEYDIEDVKIGVMLREVKNPITMLKAENRIINIAEREKPIGYDILEQDWVSPYGKGLVSDLVFTLNGYFNDYHDKDTSLIISFKNELDGVQHTQSAPDSAFKSPYNAPTGNYAKHLEIKNSLYIDHATSQQVKLNDYSDKRNGVLLFRCRTKTDGEGEIVEAIYAKMYGVPEFGGDIGDGKYAYLRIPNIYVNTNNNDRNIEHSLH